jgi:hypothetical protein
LASSDNASKASRERGFITSGGLEVIHPYPVSSVKISSTRDVLMIILFSQAPSSGPASSFLTHLPFFSGVKAKKAVFEPFKQARFFYSRLV